MPANLKKMSRVYSDETWSIYELLNQSLDPRGPDSLFDVADDYLTKESVVLDAGCRDAAHLIRLIQAHNGSSGVGVDPVKIHIERAKAAITAAGLNDRIKVVQGVMNELPYDDRHFDFVWCRDTVEQVDELSGALRETARVLKSDGHMLVYTVFTTDRLEPKERSMLMNHHMGTVPDNFIETNVEAAFADAGLAIKRKEVVGTEWREYSEEHDPSVSKALLKLNRLRRQRETIVNKSGKDIFDHIEANLHWEAYILLGKLQPTLYILSKTV
jgi:ubiquinone/menaquinone biosynthesis C-methylase UbiE